MADILISGMEMPKDKHTITITICHDGYVVVEYRDIEPLQKEIEIYKAIPLPEGHGRLGDLDALRKAMYHEAFETDSPMKKWESGWWIRFVPAEGGTDECSEN